jgi:CBS domain-containing protein
MTPPQNDVEQQVTIEEKSKTLPADTAAENKQADSGKISETIQRMLNSSADLPGESISMPLTLTAKDIMQKEIVWANPDDSVQQTLTKMLQQNVGYVLVGTPALTEGIVSKSDLTAAISPYLRPTLAKWRRPLDDASLQIKIKWIMTKPVKTIKPQMPVYIIMENMCRLNLRCLPVSDEQGKIQGLVTVFDIFNALLKTNPPI